MKLTVRECAELRWLSWQHTPVWGAHLQRGEPLKNNQMLRWLELGLIEAIGMRGYRITPAGRAALEKP